MCYAAAERGALLTNARAAAPLCCQVYAGASRRTDLLLLLGAAHYQLGQYDLSVSARC